MTGCLRSRMSAGARLPVKDPCSHADEETSMAQINSKTGQRMRDYSVAELSDAANLMRGYDLVSLCAAGSGHAGGTLSIMDITPALYLHLANHDPAEPSWDGRDRI